MGEYEETEPTEEELVEDYEFRQAFAQLANAWEAAGRKCRCGKPISLEDAWDFGCCDECRLEEVPF